MYHVGWEMQAFFFVAHSGMSQAFAGCIEKKLLWLWKIFAQSL